MTATPRIYSMSLPGARAALRQSEIVAGLVQLIPRWQLTGQTEEIVVDLKVHPYAVVLTQDCELDQDYKARTGRMEQNPDDKLIPSVLFCEVVTAEELRGNSAINSKIWAQICINKNERYHFLQKVNAEEDADREGLPELGIDFKRYFTIPTDEVYRQVGLYKAKRRCVLESPYLEHLGSRFTYFMGRIALPLDHQSE